MESLNDLALWNFIGQDFQCKPLQIEEFLKTVLSVNELEKVYKEDLIEKYNSYYKKPNKHIYTGGSRTKITSIVGLSYMVYFLSCLKNPQSYLGIMDDTVINFNIYNGENFYDLITFILMKLKVNYQIESEMGNVNKTIMLPNNIFINFEDLKLKTVTNYETNSKNIHINNTLGKAVIGVYIDLPDEDVHIGTCSPEFIEAVLNMICRMDSRFLTKYGNQLYINIDSKNSNEFTNELISTIYRFCGVTESTGKYTGVGNKSTCSTKHYLSDD